VREERFYIASVSGYPVPLHPHIFENGRYATLWYVYDRYRCCREVAEFVGVRGRVKAFKLAWQLNRDERKWEREHGD
jgi:hypothetical protein